MASGITSSTSITATGAASTTDTKSIAGNFTQFLTLLTTQLKNQNPLDPLDTNQFTQQLVQFAGVEQQLKTNASLDTILTNSKAASAEPLTRVLATLGSRRVWTVHGSDGLNEITTTGPTAVVALEDGALSHFTIDPREVGLRLATLDDLRGGDPEHNAAALGAVLEGARNAYRDIAVLNAGAGLVVAGAAGSLAEGVARAQAAIDSGAARETLARLVAVSNA